MKTLLIILVLLTPLAANAGPFMYPNPAYTYTGGDPNELQQPNFSQNYINNMQVQQTQEQQMERQRELQQLIEQIQQQQRMRSSYEN